MESINAYANRVEVNSSVYDLLLTFYQSLPIKNEKGEIISEENCTKVNIAMSPQHAKALMIALNQQINWYEGEFGVIKLSKDDVTPSEKR